MISSAREKEALFPWAQRIWFMLHVLSRRCLGVAVSWECLITGLYFQVRLKHTRQFCRTHTRIPRDARYFLSVLRGHVVHRRKQRCGLEGTLRMVGVAIGKLGHHTRRVPSEGSHLPRKGMRWMGTVTCELVPAVLHDYCIY